MLAREKRRLRAAEVLMAMQATYAALAGAMGGEKGRQVHRRMVRELQKQISDQ